MNQHYLDHDSQELKYFITELCDQPYQPVPKQAQNQELLANLAKQVGSPNTLNIES